MRVSLLYCRPSVELGYWTCRRRACARHTRTSTTHRCEFQFVCGTVHLMGHITCSYNIAATACVDCVQASTTHRRGFVWSGTYHTTAYALPSTHSLRHSLTASIIRKLCFPLPLSFSLPGHRGGAGTPVRVLPPHIQGCMALQHA